MERCYSAATNRELIAITPFTETVRLELYCILGKVVIHAEKWVKCKASQPPTPRDDNPGRTSVVHRAAHAGLGSQQYALLS